jgi:hypothetical protein
MFQERKNEKRKNKEKRKSDQKNQSIAKYNISEIRHCVYHHKNLPTQRVHSDLYRNIQTTQRTQQTESKVHSIRWTHQRKIYVFFL